MVIINESAIAGIICDSQILIENGVRKVYERSGKPGHGIEIGMREISEGIGGLKAAQALMYKAYNVPQKMTVNYGG